MKTTEENNIAGSNNAGQRTKIQICKTDLKKIIKYLGDAAVMYDNQSGQRNVCRAWIIRQLIKKLTKKLYN